MKRRTLFSAAAALAPLALSPTARANAAAPVLMGTGDLGVVIERASGAISIVNTSNCEAIGRVQGLGDLSHASVVFSRDERYAYVFGRDGGLSKVDLLTETITHRVMQAGNSIGGAINAEGSVVAAQNYTPGGVKLFCAANLRLLADLPATTADGKPSRVVVWPTCPTSVLSTACSMRMRSASPTTQTSTGPRSTPLPTSARSPTTRCSAPTVATTSQACSAKTAWRLSICGTSNRARAAF